MDKYAAETGGPKKTVPREVMRKLADFDWPGNIRQLENEVKRLLAFAVGEPTVDDLSAEVRAARGSGSSGGGAKGKTGPIEEGIGVVSVRGKSYAPILADVYKAVPNDKENSGEKAAKALGRARSTFYYRLKEAGISLKKGKG